MKHLIERCPEGHKSEVLGNGPFFVACSHMRTCWSGPLCVTRNGAVAKWNRAIGRSKKLLREVNVRAFDRGYAEAGGDK